MVAGNNGALAGEQTLPPLLRLANPALGALNVGRNADFVGVEQRVASAVPDNAARGPSAAARTWGDGRAPELRRADLEQLIAREYAGLRLLLLRRTRDPDLAADLLNDAICTAWQKWQAGQIQRPELIAGYVYQVAMNLLRNQRRSVGDRPDRRADCRALDGLAGEPEPDPVEQSAARQTLRILRGMTPLRDRELIIRFYLEEEDRESICRDLQLTPDQFAKVLHRARRRLRELVEARGIRGGDLFSLMLCIA